MTDSYDIFLPHMFPIYIYYYILLIFASFLTFKLFNKWRERRQLAALHLTLVFISLLIAIIMLIIGMTEAVITGYFKEIYRITLPLAYCMVVIADIILYLFTTKITNKGHKAFIPIIVMGVILIIIILLPWNYWGQPSENYKGKLYIRLYTSIFFVSYSILIYLTIAIISIKTKNRSSDHVARIGLSLLFYSVLCMIGFFIFIMLDNMVIALYGHPGYSIFIYFAWLFTLLFAFLSYFSLIMPNWLIKRIKKKEI